MQSEIQTERLLLRRWRPEDREPFATMNADPTVMEFFSKPLAREESDALADRIETFFAEHDYGLWAIEIPSVTPFAGFIGLSIPRYETPFTPCVEVGWRLAVEHWGRGYAPEGARAAIQFGFNQLGLREIVSYTAVQNLRSRRVMEKIGMRHCRGEDFDHPLLPPGDSLSRHVLYRLGRT